MRFFGVRPSRSPLRGAGDAIERSADLSSLFLRNKLKVWPGPTSRLQ